jgi:hypothetical protein
VQPTDSCRPLTEHDRSVTVIWFIVWLIWNNVGDHEPLLVDPVNWWAGTLILAVALDLGGHHAASGRRRP